MSASNTFCLQPMDTSTLFSPTQSERWNHELPTGSTTVAASIPAISKDPYAIILQPKTNISVLNCLESRTASAKDDLGQDTTPSLHGLNRPQSPTEGGMISTASLPTRGTTSKLVTCPKASYLHMSPPPEDNLDIDTHIEEDNLRISAYARLDFENYNFFVQTLQVVLGRKSNNDILPGSHHAVDVHLSSKKAISRRHAKIFYNFGTQRFELLILGRNGAFVNKAFMEKGITVPLADSSKIQIGDITFKFVLPRSDSKECKTSGTVRPLNPLDAVNLRTNLYNSKSHAGPHKQKAKSSIKLKRPNKQLQHSRLIDSECDNRGSSGVADISNSRRGSILKIKKVLGARRKSRTSASHDEINVILQELGISTTEAINDDDLEFLDLQVQSILDGEISHNKLVLDRLLLDTDKSDAQAIEDAENEIDRMSLKHNMMQGVIQGNTQSDTARRIRELEADLSVLNVEILTLESLAGELNNNLRNTQLASLVEDRIQISKEIKGLIRLAATFKGYENPQSRNSLEFEVKEGLHEIKSSNKVYTCHEDAHGELSTGLKYISALQGTRKTLDLMGKAASIQPPSNRVYDRINSDISIDGALFESGIRALHLGLGSDVSNAHGYFTDQPYSLPQHEIQCSAAPKLRVPVLTMTSEPPAVRSRPPLRAITVCLKPNLSTFEVPKTIEEPTKYPKIPQKRREAAPKMPKQIYSLDEIPEQYKQKPNYSQTLIVMNALKSKPLARGLTLGEIYEAIKVIYPYYFFCPDGWQFGISHQVQLNKIFKRVEKVNGEWNYNIDELYINEREKMRIKQQEIVAQRAKIAIPRAEEFKQRTQQKMSQISISDIGGPYSSNLDVRGSNPSSLQYPSVLDLLNKSGSSLWSATYNTGRDTQRSKTIAELANEIKREGYKGDGSPSVFKSYLSGQTQPSEGGLNSGQSHESASKPHRSQEFATSTIKDQLAANRAQVMMQSSSAQSNPNSGPSTQSQHAIRMDQSTKNSLSYLQNELFTLYKARKLSYNTAVTTEIITKALATTIAQVNVIGSQAGCSENPLNFLVERVPLQVSKILDIALTKSINERNKSIVSTEQKTEISNGSPGIIAANTGKSLTDSLLATQASLPTLKPDLWVSANEIKAPLGTDANYSTGISPEKAAITGKIERDALSLPSQNSDNANSVQLQAAGMQILRPKSISTTHVGRSCNISRPPSFKGNSLGRPAAFGTQHAKSDSIGNAGALSRQPSFLSNKPLSDPTSFTPDSIHTSNLGSTKREAQEGLENSTTKTSRTH